MREKPGRAFTKVKIKHYVENNEAQYVNQRSNHKKISPVWSVANSCKLLLTISTLLYNRDKNNSSYMNLYWGEKTTRDSEIHSTTLTQGIKTKPC